MNELVFNGIDAVTGAYLTPPMTLQRLVNEATGESLDEGHTAELSGVGGAHLGVAEDPRRLDLVGWAVITTENDPGATVALQRLRPLLDLRREAAGDLYREFVYKAGESKSQFLARYNKGAGPVSPEKVPYYLLIVGSPEAIPFSFQYALDVQYAVGRIDFATPQEYANYAYSVVAAETGGIRLPRSAAFWGVERDPATQQSARHLVQPLVKWMEDNAPGWAVQHLAGDAANRQNLRALLGAGDVPAFLFTASHGITFPADHPDQRGRQGALLCADWPGPEEWKKPLLPEFFLCADDVDGDAHLAGLISFTFACYGAGTPKEDDFDQLRLNKFTQLAARPFVASLPTRLLGHPNGGALAAVGHVDRTWGYSFLTEDNRRETEVFSSMLDWLLQGYPVGAAMEFFGARYAELGNELLPELRKVQEFGKKVNAPEFVAQLTAHMDSRSYIIVGDPAVRLAVIGEGAGDAETPLTVGSQPAPPPVPPASGSAAPPAPADPPAAAGGSESVAAQLAAVVEALAQAEQKRSQEMQALLAQVQQLIQTLRAE